MLLTRADGMGLPSDWPAGLPVRDCCRPDAPKHNGLCPGRSENSREAHLPLLDLESRAGSEATERGHNILFSPSWLSCLFNSLLLRCSITDSSRHRPPPQLNPYVPRLQCHLLRLYVMMEMFHICHVHFSGHEPHVATEQLRCSCCDMGNQFLLLINFN